MPIRCLDVGARPDREARGHDRGPVEKRRAVLRIAEAAHLDVGGVEYLVDDRDGEIYYYDINALSNFVTDAERVVGFDPFVKLVDFLALRAGALVPRH